MSDVSTIDYGYTASADYTVEGPKFLRITDIQEGQVKWEQVPFCNVDEPNEKKKQLRDNDIVIARSGTTGRSVLLKNPPRSVFASYLLRVRVRSTVDPNYLNHYFNTDQYWRHIYDNSRGGVQKNINARLLGDLRLPLPPLPEQERIAGMLNKQMIGIEMVETSSEAQLADIEAMPSALLRWAFSERCDDHRCLPVRRGRPDIRRVRHHAAVQLRLGPAVHTGADLAAFPADSGRT